MVQGTKAMITPSLVSWDDVKQDLKYMNAVFLAEFINDR